MRNLIFLLCSFVGLAPSWSQSSSATAGELLSALSKNWHRVVFANDQSHDAYSAVLQYQDDQPSALFLSLKNEWNAHGEGMLVGGGDLSASKICLAATLEGSVCHKISREGSDWLLSMESATVPLEEVPEVWRSIRFTPIQEQSEDMLAWANVVQDMVKKKLAQ